MKDSTSFSIFEKDQGGSYTKLALLYQDILKFSVVVKEGSPFKERELAKWLLYNNLYYINYYKDPSTKKTNENNRVEYILDRIKDKLDDLIRLGYLESDTAPAEKGLGNVRICKSTGEAELTQCIIESIDPNKRQKAYDTAYNILQKTFNIDQSSLSIFDSKLYKKYKDESTDVHQLYPNSTLNIEADQTITLASNTRHKNIVICKEVTSVTSEPPEYPGTPVYFFVVYIWILLCRFWR